MRFSAIFFAGLAIGMAGCDHGLVSIDERVMPDRNPTNYEFEASLEDVKVAINKARGEEWMGRQGLYLGDSLMWGKEAESLVKGWA
jgi:hypothetical protein